MASNFDEKSNLFHKCQNPRCLNSFQKKKWGPLGMYCSSKCKAMMFYARNKEKALQERHDYYMKNKSKKCAWAQKYYKNVAKEKRHMKKQKEKEGG
jgi:hypothetical protein